MGTDPGVGNGTPMAVSGSNISATINVSNWNEGTYRLYVRARDLVGNWSGIACPEPPLPLQHALKIVDVSSVCS